MRKHVRLLVIGTLVSSMTLMPMRAAHAQIPVTDIAHIFESVLQYIQLVEQYKNMVDRYKILFQQLEESRGITGIGRSINALLNQTRADFPDLAPSINFKVPVWDPDKIFPRDSRAKQDYIRRAEFIFTNIEKVNVLYESLANRRSSLQSLQNQVDVAETPKQIQDLNTRINSENAMLQNDLAMVNLLNISLSLSQQALEHDEHGRRISELLEPADVK